MMWRKANYFAALNAPNNIRFTGEVMKGYEKLDDVLARAFNQASQGKGAERHATEAPFHEQPMQQVNAMVGVGFSNGQAIKKIVESQNMAPEKAVHELLGAICYLAGSIITIEAANDNKTLQSVSYSDDPQPDIKSAVHEYLDENANLQTIDELDEMLGNFPKNWIKVPQGAMHFMVGFKDSDGAFYDKDFKNVYPINERNAWVKCWIGRSELISNGGSIVWTRNPLPLTREQAREVLANMERGDKLEIINGWEIGLSKSGFNGSHGMNGFCNEPSLKGVLDIIFEGKA